MVILKVGAWNGAGACFIWMKLIKFALLPRVTGFECFTTRLDSSSCTDQGWMISSFPNHSSFSFRVFSWHMLWSASPMPLARPSIANSLFLRENQIVNCDRQRQIPETAPRVRAFNTAIPLSHRLQSRWVWRALKEGYLLGDTGRV